MFHYYVTCQVTVAYTGDIDHVALSDGPFLFFLEPKPRCFTLVKDLKFHLLIFSLISKLNNICTVLLLK